MRARASRRFWTNSSLVDGIVMQVGLPDWPGFGTLGLYPDMARMAACLWAEGRLSKSLSKRWWKGDIARGGGEGGEYSIKASTRLGWRIGLGRGFMVVVEVGRGDGEVRKWAR